MVSVVVAITGAECVRAAQFLGLTCSREAHKCIVGSYKWL